MIAPSDKNEYYTLPDNLDRVELLRKLTTDHNFILDPPHKKKEEFLDTFDRRLHSANLVLIKEGNSYFLRDLTQGHTVAFLENAKDIDPKFWWDFPKCSLRSEIKPLSNIRALLSLAKIERSIATLRLLNKDKKTVLLTYVKELRMLNANESKPSAVVVQIKPLKGYEKEAQDFKKYLSELGLVVLNGDIISATRSFDGKYPLNYSSKINVNLKPEMKSLDAAKLIFQNLLETMKVNEFGIIEDIDTEFLHDFRVAVRRTRSALSQIKAVFSDKDTMKFKDEFSSIGKATNELRDLDVYLLTEDSYKKMLPEDLRPGLDPLFDSLSEQREKAKKECADYLRSDSYKKSIKTWEDFLNSRTNPELAVNSEKPIIELAKEYIWKKYSKVIKLGNKIQSNTPDPEVHGLRIECKKLRYLLEFFMSLFPEGEIKVVIKHLKKLQDNLGDFNDLYVQQESLKKFLSQTEIGYDQSKQQTLAAAGGLVSVLYQRQNAVRRNFKENFDGFSDKETTSLFNKLFAKDK